MRRSRPPNPAEPARRPRRVLICPDKFKGTLTATQAAQAIAEGWGAVQPADVCESVPISDGGDGFGELLGRQLGAEECQVETVDAAHRPVRASWWWDPASRTAIVESARIVGLAMLPVRRFHPFDLDTFGLGAVLAAVARKRPRRCLVGIGGSATNDAGFGFARALGWRFLDALGAELSAWTQLPRLDRIEAPRAGLRLGEVVVAVDVRNPLLGPHGATRVYGPQKGLQTAEAPRAEACLRRLAQVVNRQLSPGSRPARRAGAGAAGGLGFGLRVFAGARLESGFELFTAQIGLAARIRAADLVITGEGAIDETTLSMGKGVGGVARLCRRFQVPCLGLAGVIPEPERAGAFFTRVRAIVPELADPPKARREAARLLGELARRSARTWPAWPAARRG